MSLSLLSDSKMTLSREENEFIIENDILIPSGSLLLLCQAARYEMKHEIKQCNIQSRRLCITIRDLNKNFIQNNKVAFS